VEIGCKQDTSAGVLLLGNNNLKKILVGVPELRKTDCSVTTDSFILLYFESGKLREELI
jgi:hypothetical protein